MQHRNWHILNAEEHVLGRLASQAAQLLMGKHKPGFVRHKDNGDFVVVINAEKIKVTGNKEKKKVYTRYSGYPGGLKTIPLGDVRTRKPAFLVEHAVSGMLPKNKLQNEMLKRLKVIVGPEHPYADRMEDKETKSN